MNKLGNLIDLHGEWGRNVFSQSFQEWEKISPEHRIRLLTHTRMHNSLTMDSNDPLSLSMYIYIAMISPLPVVLRIIIVFFISFATELNECVNKQMDGTIDAYLVACKSSVSDLVNILPNLANWVVRRLRLFYTILYFVTKNNYLRID
jgi:hypothetical protein